MDQNHYDPSTRRCKNQSINNDSCGQNLPEDGPESLTEKCWEPAGPHIRPRHKRPRPRDRPHQPPPPPQDWPHRQAKAYMKNL